MPSSWPSCDRMKHLRGVIALVAGALASAGAAAADDAAVLAQGRALFTQGAAPPCAVCHTLKDAGTAGAIGPVLDELRPDAQRVATAVKGGIGLMPSYRATLTEAQIQALARYVSKASGGAS